MIEIGFHTDAFNSSYWNFEQCLQWAQKNDVHWIECGMIDGVSWIHGLGYQPHVAMWEDPMMWREKAESVQRGQNHLHQKIGRNLGGFLKERFHVKKETSPLFVSYIFPFLLKLN